MTEQLSKEMNDKDEVIDTLIFENLLYTDYDKNKFKMTISEKEYPATIKQAWKLLNKK